MLIREFTIEDAQGKTVTFKIAPTPLSKLVESKRLFETGQLDTEAGMQALIRAIFHGARRAKSEITLEWLEENVDIHNSRELFALFRELNQVTIAAPGGKKANGLGETPAAVSASSTSSSGSPPTS